MPIDTLAVNVAFQFQGAQLGLHLLRSVSRVRPHPRTGIALHQQVIHLLAVMHSGGADVIAADSLCFRSTLMWFL